MIEFTFVVSYARLAAMLLVGFCLIGPAYAWLLNRPTVAWLPDHATELSVVIGVGLTLGLLLLVLPSLLVLLVSAAFAATGFWQLLRSAYNRTVIASQATAAEKANLADLIDQTQAQVNGASQPREAVR